MFIESFKKLPKEIILDFDATDDPAYGAWSILKLLSKRFREVWPDVKIIFRADSGFCSHLMMNWCDKQEKPIHYIIGIPRNPRLEELTTPLIQKAQDQFEATDKKQRLFDDLNYAAESWKHERGIIVKTERTAKGKNLRFMVTNLTDDNQDLYEKLYSISKRPHAIVSDGGFIGNNNFYTYHLVSY